MEVAIAALVIPMTTASARTCEVLCVGFLESSVFGSHFPLICKLGRWGEGRKGRDRAPEDLQADVHLALKHEFLLLKLPRRPAAAWGGASDEVPAQGPITTKSTEPSWKVETGEC